RPIRTESEAPPGRKAQAVELAGNRHTIQVVATRDRREEHLLVLATDVTHGVDAPGSFLPGAVPQCLERNGELRLPAALGHAATDDPVGIPIEIESAAIPLARLPFS